MDIHILVDKAFKRDLSDASALNDAFDTLRLLEPEDFTLAHEKNKEVRRLSAKYAAERTDMKMFELNKRSLLFDAPYDFDCFLRYIEWQRPNDKRFYMPRRKVLLPIVNAFQQVADGELDLLTVSQPKRTGKTTLGLMFVLFRAGQHPGGSSICSGAGNDLVKSFYTGCLDILQKPEEYLYYDVFPKARLAATNADEKTIHLEKKKRFATITCRSIDGALTGSTESTPEGVMYLDDLVSDELEANNRNRLDTLWDKVRGDLLGRRLEGCPIVAQGTRYSLYDPLGRLQEIAPTMGWRTKVVEIPALDPITDESNFEIVLNGKPAFTTEYYRHERELVTPVQWASQFQQEPFEAKGLLFPENELNRYFELPVDQEPDAIISVCDTAEGGGDSVMMPIAYIYGEDVFIEDCVFDNSTPEHTKPECAKKLVDHKVSVATFESNNAGSYFARDVEELVKKMGGRVSIRTRRTISNKQTRIEMASDGILKHFYFKDKSLYKPSDQYGQMMRELVTYTRTGKVKHDDSPDGLSLLENEIRNLTWGKAEVFHRPF
jgi:predicted phage terminase large subunit-like protein